MNLRKKLSILLTVCMVFSSIPFTVFAEEPAEELVQEAVVDEVATGSETESDYTVEATASDIVLEATAEDGMKVTLKADNDAFEYADVLTLEAIVVTEEVAEEASEELEVETEDDNVAKRVTYDIRVLYEGEEIQPVDGKKVTVEFSMSDIPSGADAVSVYHHNEETDEIETIIDEAPVNENTSEMKSESETVIETGSTSKSVKNAETADAIDEEYIPEDADIIDDVTVKGETASFSLYTVDFTYDKKIVNIAGDTDHNKLSDILAKLNITEVIEGAEAYSDAACTELASDGIVKNANGDALFKVYEEDDVWYVDAINAFSTEHGLIVTTKNAEYKIKVTDDGGSGKVAKIVATGVEYDTVQGAVDKISEGAARGNIKYGTISMIGDSAENVIIRDYVNITLDLNGHMLSAPGEGCVIHMLSCTLYIQDSNTDNLKHNFKVESSGLWATTSETATTTFESLTSRPATGTVIEVTGGCITGGKGEYVGSSYYGGGGIYSSNKSNLTLFSGNIIGNTADNGGGVLASGVTVQGGIICGNKAKKGGGVSNGTGGNLSVKGGTISYNIAEEEGGGIYNMNGNVNVDDGIVSNNVSGNGGGIYNGYTTNLNGGIVSKNEASRGGGVYSSQNATVMMSGNAIITTNIATTQGGGVFNSGEGFIPKAGTIPGATFVMTGGTISANDSAQGGGIYNDGGGLVKLSGNSSINSNTATVQSGGIYCDDASQCSYVTSGLSVEGEAKVENNAGNNVFICTDNTITVGASGLSGAAHIGVTTETKPAKDSPVDVTGVNSADYATYFFSDSNAYEIYNKEDNTVALRYKENQDPVTPETKPGKSSSSVYTTGWHQSGNNWQYVKADGTFAKNEWIQIEVNGVKKWYHFGSDTMMDTGWFLDTDGSWYYLSKEDGQDLGTMKTGWMTDPYDGYRYYLDPATGKMLIGWHVIDGKRHYFNEHVPSASGWTQDEKGDWVYDKQEVIPLGAMIR